MFLCPNFACNGRRIAAVLGHFKATTEESFSLTRTKPHSLQVGIGLIMWKVVIDQLQMEPSATRGGH